MYLCSAATQNSAAFLVVCVWKHENFELSTAISSNRKLSCVTGKVDNILDTGHWTGVQEAGKHRSLYFEMSYFATLYTIYSGPHAAKCPLVTILNCPLPQGLQCLVIINFIVFAPFSRISDINIVIYWLLNIFCSSMNI